MAAAEAACSDGVEAVSICAPNIGHAETPATVLRAGVDVILDRLLTATVDDARLLVALQRETGASATMTYPSPNTRWGARRRP